MHTDRLHGALSDALTGRMLLTHPFYRRWEAGALGEGELAAYAEQYRHLERELPRTLAAIAAALPEGEARTLVQSNLSDELGTPGPHVDLFESFARATGAGDDVAPSEATAALLATIRSAAATDPVAALAMVAAYEVQASDIASSKSDGLRRHYAMGTDETVFWDVHTLQEAAHADWSVRALDALGADPALVRSAAQSAADGWWDFLSEREALAAPVAGC